MVTKSVTSMVFDGFETIIGRWDIIAVAIILSTLNFAFQGVPELTQNELVPIIASLGSILVSVANLGVAIAVFTAHYNTQMSDKRKIMSQIKTRLLPLLGVQIAVGITVFVGFLLLVIPGIYFAYKLYLAPAVCVVEQKGIIESLQASWGYTGNNTGQVLGLVVLSALLQISIFLVAILGVAVAAIWTPLIALFLLIIPAIMIVSLGVQAALADMVLQYSDLLSSTTQTQDELDTELDYQ